MKKIKLINEMQRLLTRMKQKTVLNTKPFEEISSLEKIIKSIAINEKNKAGFIIQINEMRSLLFEWRQNALVHTQDFEKIQNLENIAESIINIHLNTLKMHKREFKFENGETVTDEITGFSGVITGTCFYLNEANKYEVTARSVNEFLPGKAEWFREDRLSFLPPADTKQGSGA